MVLLFHLIWLSILLNLSCFEATLLITSLSSYTALWDLWGRAAPAPSWWGGRGGLGRKLWGTAQIMAGCGPYGLGQARLGVLRLLPPAASHNGLGWEHCGQEQGGLSCVGQVVVAQRGSGELGNGWHLKGVLRQILGGYSSPKLPP